MLNRIGSLRGDEPWPDHDELAAAAVQATLGDGDREQATNARADKHRAGVPKAAERELVNT